MMSKYELFNPVTGATVRTVRGRWIARLLTWANNKRARRFLDYAPPGEGWVR